MRRVIHPTVRAKRIAAGAVFLLPAAVLQAILVSRLAWWEIPLFRIAGIAGVAFFSTWITVRAILRGAEFAWVRFALILGLWSTAFLFTAVTSHHLSALVFGLACAFWGGILILNAFRTLGTAAVDSGVRWFQGEPDLIPHTRAQLQSAQGNVLVEDLGVARVDETGIFLLFSKQKSLPVEGDYWVVVQTHEGDLKLQVQLHSFWSRGNAHGAGFLFRQRNQFNAMKPLGDWLKRLEGFGYASIS